MDRAEAIKRIETHIEYHRNGEYPFLKTDEALEMAIAALREQEQSKWISVKERLPEDDDLVLALVDGKPTENVTLVGAYELAVYDSEEKEWILEMWPEWLGANVTHWMPLPEPPKEGA